MYRVIALSSVVSALVAGAIVYLMLSPPTPTTATADLYAQWAVHIFEEAECQRCDQQERAMLREAALTTNVDETFQRAVNTDGAFMAQLAHSYGVEVRQDPQGLDLTFQGTPLYPAEKRQLLEAYEAAGGAILNHVSACHDHRHTREAQLIVAAFEDASWSDRDTMLADPNISYVIGRYRSARYSDSRW